jgi:hypothetical protein
MMSRKVLGFGFSALVLAVGCSGDGLAPECVNSTSGEESKFVANTLTLPKAHADFAIDLDGNGTPDNQLGNIIGVLNGQFTMGNGPQDGVNQALQKGNVLLLFDEKGASLSSAECASVDFAAGNQPANPPKYDGSDTFTINAMLGGGTFKGRITGSAFNSNSPVTTTNPTNITVLLPIVAGVDPITLSITGAHLQFTKSGDTLMKGQINGAIKSTDVQNEIIPSVAQLLNKKINMDPTSSSSMTLLSIFDSGMVTHDPSCPDMSCKNPDGTCSKPMDKTISVCEVGTNSLIKSVLSPDVQMFQNGVYKPNKDKTVKDSLSMGLAFTAVKANF